MNIREISDIFKDTADNITAIKSYNFGWASDRVRQGNTEDFQELNEFPRVFFAVPTITGSDQTRKQDTYQVTIFFDDLLGYDNEGDEDPTLQIDKWANLQQYANYFVQRLNKIKQTILPNYLFIPEAPSITFDSFTGLQRMITVQLSFNLVVPTNCDPGVITLVQCIANIVTSSNLTASLTTVLKFAASLEGRATVTADINFVQKVASSLNANALLSGDISFVQKAQANLSALASLTGDINFVQKAQAALLTSSSVTGNIIIPKLVQASLTGAGTTAADLTVTAAASLLLDLYPSAAVAYSLRKLRSAYTGNAIRVRRSSDNTEQNIGFDVNGNLDTTALTTFVGSGNGFVTTWYDQSGNARDATQTTQANQPQIVSSGIVITLNNKSSIEYTSSVNMNLSVPNSTSLFNFLHNGTSSNLIHVGSVGGISTSRVIIRNALGSATVGFFIYRDVGDKIATQINYGVSGSVNTLNVSLNNSYLLNKQNLLFTSFDADNATASNRSIMYVDNGNAINLNSTLNPTSTANSTNNLIIGDGLFGNFVGKYQEIIIYDNDNNSNRSGISTNINTHYAIY